MTQLSCKFKTLIMGTLTAALLNACSGHTLQDLADEAFNQKQSVLPHAETVGIEGNTATNATNERADFSEKTSNLHNVKSKPQVTAGNTTDDKINTTATMPVSPSENPALQSVSPAPTASDKNVEHRIMQEKTNAWIEEEWTPKVETNATIKKQNEDKERPFTLQEYVDKAGVYLEEKEKEQAGKPKKPSHKEQMDKLPVIGK